MSRFQTKQESARVGHIRSNVAQKLNSIASNLKAIKPYLEVERTRDGFDLQIPEDVIEVLDGVLLIAADLTKAATLLTEDLVAKRAKEFEYGTAIHEDNLRRQELKRNGRPL